MFNFLKTPISNPLKSSFVKNIPQIVAVSFITAFLTASLTSYLFRQSDRVILNDNNSIEQNNEFIPVPPVATQKGSDSVVGVVDKVATKDLPVFEQEFINPFGNDDFFSQFFGPFQPQIPQQEQKGTEKREVAGGTGFIVSSDGLIVTNRHVVDIEGAEYTVITNKNERYSAQLLAKDPVEDLAILKINKTGLPTVELGNSDEIKVGQSVVAIGNALGEFQNTVSVGVVAGLNRTINIPGQNGQRGETIAGAIQTDAAINPGNSGGPLLNLKGEVIGINTAIVVGSQNIGFAIPVNKARRDLNSINSAGKISYPYLGVRYVLVNEDIQKEQNLTVSYGALILKGTGSQDPAIMPGSPAESAGLKEGDVILELNGQKVDFDNSLAALVQKRQIGETVTLKVLSDGIEKTINVTLAERP
ncbi:MAG: HtrA2 peptidase [Parcubacteria group bacterium GW2011_GWB1_40_14]|nr:MAG: HtrA2 peptidase [Parcubacteria group bacterium GW2011_GWB1_40_14]